MHMHERAEVTQKRGETRRKMERPPRVKIFPHPKNTQSACAGERRSAVGRNVLRGSCIIAAEAITLSNTPPRIHIASPSDSPFLPNWQRRQC
jgi:hypothetical protein